MQNLKLQRQYKRFIKLQSHIIMHLNYMLYKLLLLRLNNNQINILKYLIIQLLNILQSLHQYIWYILLLISNIQQIHLIRQYKQLQEEQYRLILQLDMGYTILQK